jgi:drug/metabolite transporter (DMT)-like permease
MRKRGQSVRASPGVAGWQRIGGPALFVLLWSTGFVGAKYGLPYAEPFTFLSIRLVLAGTLLAAVALATRSAGLASGRQYVHAATVGVFLHAGYLGGVFYAISIGMPAGATAVVVSLQPVLTAVLATRLLGERLRARQWLGFVLGVVGVALVVMPGLVAGQDARAIPLAGVGACVVSLASGTTATLYQKRHGDGIPLVWGTVVQYTAAAAVLIAAAGATESVAVTWTAEFLAALIWLVVVLSLGAVLLLLLLLRRGSASSVSSLLYLVPPATACEAYFLFGERLSQPALIGVVVAAAGVALVVTPARRRTMTVA